MKRNLLLPSLLGCLVLSASVLFMKHRAAESTPLPIAPADTQAEASPNPVCSAETGAEGRLSGAWLPVGTLNTYRLEGWVDTDIRLAQTTVAPQLEHFAVSGELRMLIASAEADTATLIVWWQGTDSAAFIMPSHGRMRLHRATGQLDGFEWSPAANERQRALAESTAYNLFTWTEIPSRLRMVDGAGQHECTITVDDRGGWHRTRSSYAQSGLLGTTDAQAFMDEFWLKTVKAREEFTYTNDEFRIATTTGLMAERVHSSRTADVAAVLRTLAFSAATPDQAVMVDHRAAIAILDDFAMDTKEHFDAWQELIASLRDNPELAAVLCDELLHADYAGDVRDSIVTALGAAQHQVQLARLMLEGEEALRMAAGVAGHQLTGAPNPLLITAIGMLPPDDAALLAGSLLEHAESDEQRSRLLAFLHTGASSVQLEAALNSNTPLVIREIAEPLTGDSDAELRGDAIAALIGIGESRGLTIARFDADAGVRRKAVERIHGPNASGELQAFASDEDPLVRIQVLQKFKGLGILEPIREAQLFDPNQDVRFVAGQLLE